MPQYIHLLNLEKHIEGGYFGIVYRSQDKVIPLHLRYKDNIDHGDYQETRCAGSSIYFLLEREDFSAWHRLKSDEIWHYYDGGSPIDIYAIDVAGELKRLVLGNPVMTDGAHFQVVIKAGCWFAAEVRDKSSFALVGCTVSPGFEYQDFELAEHNQFITQFPYVSTIGQFFPLDKNITKTDTPNEIIHTIVVRNYPISAKLYVEKLNLEKHIEGGYFGIVYRSQDKVIPLHLRYKDNIDHGDYQETRCAGSSIYFLLEREDFSAWHRLKSDEIWHYYDGGSPIDIYAIDVAGELKRLVLGNPVMTDGAHFQVVIKAGCWFAAEVRDKSSFALVGCTVSPGFEYQDFELAERLSMINQYNHYHDIIKKFTRVSHTAHPSWTHTAMQYAATALISGLGLYFTYKFHQPISDNFFKLIQPRQ